MRHCCKMQAQFDEQVDWGTNWNVLGAAPVIYPYAGSSVHGNDLRHTKLSSRRDDLLHKPGYANCSFRNIFNMRLGLGDLSI